MNSVTTSSKFSSNVDPSILINASKFAKQTMKEKKQNVDRNK